MKIQSNLFEDLKNLNSIFLFQNKINVIDLNGFKGLDNLEVLHLGNNRLTKIEANLFQNLKKLNSLSFFTNDNNKQINEFDSNAFNGLEYLEELDLWKHYLRVNVGSTNTL